MRGLVLAVLIAAVLVTLQRIHAFGQQRFFTIDEYQFAHATWLVSEGQRPYVDFYEHHFPLSYVLHAPLLRLDGTFSEKVLRLRALPFVYMAGLALALLLATRVVTCRWETPLLCASLPLVSGFGLMSAVDYRADNFAAFTFVAALAGLEANRHRRSALLAALCGAGLAAAVLMTQKMVYFAGGSGLVLLACEALHARRRRKGTPPPDALPWLAHSGWVVGAAAGVGAAALAVAGALGLLGPGFEFTVLQAIQHEAVHPEVGIGRFVGPYWEMTRASTVVLAALAGAFLVSSAGRFWLVPVAVTTLAVSRITAQYPYNYVLPCLLGMLCAARGAGVLAARLPLGPAEPLRPLLWLLPLALVPAQLGFLEGRTSNAHQLRLLEKVERYSGPEDRVIDDAGGAIFRGHGSYYWYQGGAHRQIFSDYFESELARDYRESRALFWIRDLRLRWLPEPVRDHFRRHYVRADGDLFVLGFRTPRTGDEPREVEVELLRGGRYHLRCDGEPPRLAVRGGAAVVAGSALDLVASSSLDLVAGVQRLAVPAHAASCVASPLPVEVFDPVIGERTHSPLFEYDRMPDRTGAVGGR